jgi:hypothetical protein
LGVSEAGLDCVSPALVTSIDAAHEGLLALRFARQGFLEHVNDVAWRQQVEARIVSDALLGNEQHCQHHHGDMVVPGLPAQRLIIGQAALAFGIFEDALYPIAMPLI